MKKSAKALLLSLCAVLLVAVSVMGTLAYLTSKDEVKNTFTVGRVSISLDEAWVNDEGKPIDDESNPVSDLKDAKRVKGNEYHLLPGHAYTKDPTVHIAADSEEAYYRMLVTVTFKEDISTLLGTDLNSIFTGYDANWERTGYSVAPDSKSINYEYRYNTTVANDSETDVKDLEPLFTEIRVPTELNNETLAVFAGMEINIVAHAIQADGFENAEAAWAAFDAQTP